MTEREDFALQHDALAQSIETRICRAIFSHADWKRSCRCRRKEAQIQESPSVRHRFHRQSTSFRWERSKLR